jgi:hypothetical protein
MRPNMTRRDILKLVGGSALGIFFTPVPWKLLDDTSIWTQNWSLIPALPRGERTERFSACTLCPGACGVRVACVGGMPFAMAGAAAHPVSRGYLCPAGFAAHQLAYHPLRVEAPVRFSGVGKDARLEPLSLDDAVAETAGRVASRDGAVAILDLQPGRAISAYYEEFLAGVPGGAYVVSPSREDATLAAIDSMLESSGAPYGFDFEHTDVVLSFGAPLLEGWGSPGRFAALRNRGAAGGLRLLQAECRQSKTALGADQWIPIAPGSEYLFALSIANVLLSEELYDRAAERHASDLASYRQIVSAYTPEWTELRTGVAPALTRRVAGELAAARGAVILGSSDPGGGPMERNAEYAIAGLNLLVGSVGRKGGIVSRHPMPGSASNPAPRRELRDIPDHSLSLLVVDAASSGCAFPWQLVERKLRPGSGRIVCLASTWNDIAARADIVIPAPAPFESLQDVGVPAGAAASSFGLSHALLPARAGSVDPAAFVVRVAAAAGVALRTASTEDLLKQRAAAIFAAKRGTIVAPVAGATPVAEYAGADAMWAGLEEGGTWIDETAVPAAPGRSTFATALLRPPRTEDAPGATLRLMPFGSRGAVAAADMSPVMSKLFQESQLRDLPGTVRMNPASAAELGLEAGARVRLETANGSIPAVLRTDNGVRPGVVLAAVGPETNGGSAGRRPDERILDLCDVREDGSWRMTHANVRKA